MAMQEMKFREKSDLKQMVVPLAEASFLRSAVAIIGMNWHRIMSQTFSRRYGLSRLKSWHKRHT
jgi:hypothetical protein